MKKSLYILTLLCALFWSADIISATCDDVHLGQHQNNMFGTFTFCSKEGVITKTPRWNGDMNKIPLTIDKAITVGEQWVKNNNKKFGSFVISGIDISRVGRSEIDSYWFYTLQFRPEGYRFFIPVVILMDGTVVEPIKY